MEMVCTICSRVYPVILATAESTIPWIYCYLPMNNVEERLSLLHFWIWERHLVPLIVPCCGNVFISWVFAVLKFNGFPQWSCQASKVQSPLLWLGTCFGRYSPKECPGILFIFDLYEWYALQIQNESFLQFADDTCLVMIIHRLRTFWSVI